MSSIELGESDLSFNIANLDPPFIEDTLVKYSDEESLTLLALGSSYWTPPVEAYQHLSTILLDPNPTNTIHKYGDLFGDDILRNKIKNRLNKHGLNMDNMINIITSGANQGFINICLSLINKDDNSIILAPYYCSHKMALEICGSKVNICPFQSNFYPNWDVLEEICISKKPKLLVLTSPNNPSGVVWSEDNLFRLIGLCKKYDTWLIGNINYIYNYLFN